MCIKKVEKLWKEGINTYLIATNGNEFDADEDKKDWIVVIEDVYKGLNCRVYIAPEDVEKARKILGS